MKHVTKILMGLAIVLTMGFASAPHKAWAQEFRDTLDGANGNSDLFIKGEGLAKKTVGRAQQIVFGVAGLGAIALGALAFFGRFTWSWFFGLVGGLLLISGIQLGIKYLTGQGNAFGPTQLVQ